MRIMTIAPEVVFQRFDGILVRLLDRQHQGIRLGKDLILDSAGNFEPFAAIFNEVAIYGDFAGSADEAQRDGRVSKRCSTIRSSALHVKVRVPTAAIVFVKVETPISSQAFNANPGTKERHIGNYSC